MKDSHSASHDQTVPEIMSELRVSGHLMRLDPGLFCVVQMPTPAADPASGLPGVRLSLPPGPSGRPESVQLSGFNPGGWLSGTGDAALVRVTGGPAQILVTIYQAGGTRQGAPPNLQVRRLFDGQGVPPALAASTPTPPAATSAKATRAGSTPAASTKVMEMVAHIQERGDVGAMIGEWLGEAGSKRWIEGFGIAPGHGLSATDIEYQAVLGPGWLSPWVEGGQFCGSRGMALPVLGLRIRLRGAAAAAYQVSYAASFIDGSKVGPVGEGEPCEVEGLPAMESFRVDLRPRPGGEPPRPAARPAASAKRVPMPLAAAMPAFAKRAGGKGRTLKR